jgi:drug/metabolite transporter (DMT)-like permease
LLTMLAALGFLGESVSGRQWAGAGLVALGVILIFGSGRAPSAA